MAGAVADCGLGGVGRGVLMSRALTLRVVSWPWMWSSWLSWRFLGFSMGFCVFFSGFCMVLVWFQMVSNVFYVVLRWRVCCVVFCCV